MAEKQSRAGAERRPLKVVLHERSGAGGICHYTYQLAESLTRKGADVTVLTTASYELLHLPRRFCLEFLFKPSRIKALASASLRSLLHAALIEGSAGRAGARRDAIVHALRRLRDRLLKLKAALRFLLDRPDVIHFQSVNPHEDRRFLQLLSRLGFPIVYTAHDLLPHGSVSPDDHRALQSIYGLADQVIVHAEENRRELAGLFDVEERRVAVIPHGSYDFLFASRRPSQADARRMLGVSADKKVVLFFGIIKRYKGLEYLAQAFEQVRNRLEGAMLLVVGSVYNGDPEAFREYSRLIERMSARQDVMCVAEYVPIDEVGSYLCASDVVVLPYTKTYHSGVLLSAYAAGRPVVVTDTGGLAEVVEEGRSGYVVPPRDSGALADAIVRVLESPERTAEMGRHAGRLAAEDYSWDGIASRTIDLYWKVMARRARERGAAAAVEKPAPYSSPPK